MDQQEYDYQWLPELILWQILRKLSGGDLVNMTKTSERCKNIARMKTSLWKKLDLSTFAFADGDLSEIFLFPIGELDLSGIDMRSKTRGGRPLIPFEPGSEAADPNFYLPLQKLTIKVLYDPDDVVVEILKKCRPVELVLDHSCITSQMLTALSQNQRLKVLSLSYVGYDDFTVLNLPNTIDKLMLNHAEEFWPQHFGYDVDVLTEHQNVEILRKCPKLKHLGISLYSLTLTPRIAEVVADLDLLESLWICECDFLQGWMLSFELFKALPVLSSTIKFVHITPCPIEWRDVNLGYISNGPYRVGSAESRRSQERFMSLRDSQEFSDIQTRLAEIGIDVTIECMETEYKFLLHRNKV